MQAARSNAAKRSVYARHMRHREAEVALGGGYHHALRIQQPLACVVRGLRARQHRRHAFAHAPRIVASDWTGLAGGQRRLDRSAMQVECGQRGDGIDASVEEGAEGGGKVGGVGAQIDFGLLHQRRFVQAQRVDADQRQGENEQTDDDQNGAQPQADARQAGCRRCVLVHPRRGRGLPVLCAQRLHRTAAPCWRFASTPRLRAARRSRSACRRMKPVASVWS